MLSTEEITNLIYNHLDNDMSLDEYIITLTSCGSLAITDKRTRETHEVEVTMQEKTNG